jgi:hypothetical protein
LSFKTNKGRTYDLKFNDVDYLYHIQFPLLKVDKCFNPDYVKILWTTHPDDELYISIKEIESLGFNFDTYKSILEKHVAKLNKNQSSINAKTGVNLIKNCLNLRSGPSIDANKIMCIPSNDFGNKYEIELDILELKNKWAKVKVKELHPTPNHDCNTTVKNINEGWVKAIAENGYPNIWFSVTSY